MLTELLSSVVQANDVEISRLKPKSTATSPVFMQVATPKPAQISLSVPILRASSAWNEIDKERYRCTSSF